jgi:hypothetical protein
MDADTNDIVGGLNNCLTRDGQGKPSANLNMNGFKITNMAAATVPGDAVRYEQIGASALTQGVAASGSNADITSMSALTGAINGPTSIAGATAGMTVSNVSSINSGYLYGNRVINGAQEIDQVNSGAAVTPATSPAYLTDMFGAFLSQTSKLTFQQVADAPAGLKNSMKVTVASQYAPAATDAFTLITAIEGKDVIDFQMGTSGAATFTISNWIKGSVAGTYSIALKNAALNRSYVGVISVTTSWAPVKITVTGDLTGTWAIDNTVGLYIQWDLGSGSNYNTTAGAWGAGDLRRTSGSVTFVNQVAGSTLNITGVDCRLGSIAPAYFERRAWENLLAYRYYWKDPGGVSGAGIVIGGLTQAIVSVSLPVEMRTYPTVTNISNGAIDSSSSLFTNNATLDSSNSFKLSVRLLISSATNIGSSAGFGAVLRSQVIAFSARLF